MTRVELLLILAAHEDDCEVTVAVERRDGGADLASITEVRYQRIEDGYEDTEIFIGARLVLAKLKDAL